MDTEEPLGGTVRMVGLADPVALIGKLSLSTTVPENFPMLAIVIELVVPEPTDELTLAGEAPMEKSPTLTVRARVCVMPRLVPVIETAYVPALTELKEHVPVNVSIDEAPPLFGHEIESPLAGAVEEVIVTVPLNPPTLAIVRVAVLLDPVSNPTVEGLAVKVKSTTNTVT